MRRPLAPFAGILQTSPGIVTSCLLRFKWRRTPYETYPDDDAMPETDQLHVRRSGAARLSTARSPPSRSTARRPSTRSIFRSQNGSSSSAAEVEATRRHPGAGDRRRRPRVLRRRRSADHWRRGRSRHHRARGRRTAEALSRLHRDPAADAEDRAVQRARLGRRRRAWGSPLSPTSASPPTTPASRRPTPRSACRPMAAARSAWSAPSASAARLQIFLAEDSFSAQQAYDWGLVAKIVPAAELKAATRQFARTAGAKSAGRDRRHQGADLPGRGDADQAAARRRGRRRSSTPCTPTNSASR